MCDCYSCIIFYLLPTKNPLKTLPFLLHWFSPNKMAPALNFERHNIVTTSKCVLRFREQKHRHIDHFGQQLFPMLYHANKSGLVLSIVKLKPIFKQHMNMDFRSFDKGFKQLCITNSIQKCNIIYTSHWL